ncbi:MAG TPA: tetratricopeptide repeat protein [Candidatus Angelobacter sp.]
MKKHLIFTAIAVLLFTLGSVPMWVQTVSAQVEGTVTEAGKPLPGVSVTLTSQTGRTFKMKTDKNGKFSAVGVPYGIYEVEIVSSSGEKLFHRKQTEVQPSTSSSVSKMDIDISEKKPESSAGPAGQPGQTPPGQTGETTGKPGQQPKYTKEQIEEIKKQNEKAQNTNTIIKQALDAMNAKNWQEAVPLLQQLVAIDPNNWQYQQGLGNSYFNLQQWDQAVDAYGKGIQAAENTTTVDPKNPATDPVKKKAGLGQMLTNQGNAYLKLHKNKEAVDAYTKAAAMDPNPATAYFNLCATQYNTGNVDGALQACDKAIAADPNKADAYFIKGSLLVGSSTMDKEGKMTAPPGTSEALNKYLELAPDGPHANDVKQMLAAIGSKVETTYKKRGK